MAYLKEFRVNWRTLLASTLGLAVGSGLINYVSGLFAPQMIAEFGWSRSQLALMGSLSILMFFTIPLIGRLTDLFGMHVVAATGILGLPAILWAFTWMSGDIREYFLLSALLVVVGSFSTSTVYCRLVALRFDTARGMALAIVVTGPALLSSLGSPWLGDYIDLHGWRAGYRLLSAFTLLTGICVYFLIPREREAKAPQDQATAPPARRGARQDYGLILRSPAFWLLAGGMFFINLPQILVASQFKLMLMDNGASSAAASRLIGLYAMAVLAGRFTCGLALDHVPAHLVAAVSLFLPSIGLFLLASPYDDPQLVLAAVLLIGVAQGAEGDLVSYLVVNHFSKVIYGSVVGLVAASLSIGASLGAALLGFALHLSDDFAFFLAATGTLTIIGASMFGLLGRYRQPVLVE